MMLSHNNEHNGEVCGNAHSEIASSRRGPWGDPVQRAMGRPCAEGHGETLYRDMGRPCTETWGDPVQRAMGRPCALHMKIARVPRVLAS